LDKIFCAENRRVPIAYNGIQVNYCKNPLCPNFGIPASNETPSRGRYANPEKQDGYIAKSDIKGGIRFLVCKYCSARFPAKSNIGISEEATRYSSYLDTTPERGCPNESCPNHTKSIAEHKSLYRNKGFSTKSRSSKKYLCKVCGAHISVQVKSAKKQRIPHRNKYILKALCNKVPLRCIGDIFDFEMQTIYDRIDFLYHQCLNFVAARERRLQTVLKFKRLYLSVDRQIYLVNWWDRETKKNIPICAIGCADNDSKYVFAMESNYDPSMKWNEIETKANEINDYSKPIAFRRFARLWLKDDYDNESENNNTSEHENFDQVKKGQRGDVDRNIRTRYRQAANRKDVESGDQPNEYLQLPKNGMMVRLDYCLYAFFIHLKKLLPNVEKFRFFLDQESGIRAACLSAFRDEIVNRTCDAFYVNINRNLSIDDVTSQ
jgi:transposase-like protein